MAQLWGGRFTGQTSEEVKLFGDSIFFDKALWREDIEGSIAHAKMLGRQGIISQEDADKIVGGLTQIRAEIENGERVIDNSQEDIHSYMEASLIDLIGDAGKRLHTGRSRNDQVALDMRLYVRRQADETREALIALEAELLNLMEQHTETVMPGFTHMQKAQPVTLAHHLGAYFEMFRRDILRLQDTRARLNECPLGAGALAGTTYPLDRDFTAKELFFDRPTANSMDSVSDRDYSMEYLFDLSVIMIHLSRFSEEIITWNSNEYRFIEIDDAYSTGSSIMPQKKNPDVAELIRGKTGRVFGDLTSLMTVMKGIPLAYNKDMQEDKEPVFDAAGQVTACIRVFTGMLSTLRFRKDVMRRSAEEGFTNATDAADYLVKKGVPFRDAHGIIGRMVLYCIDADKAIGDLTMDEFRSFSEAFDEGIYEAVDVKRCADLRNTAGAPGQDAMRQELAQCKDFLDSLAAEQ